jgi:hypothetical protein
MGKLLDTYDHPKLNQEDINQLNKSITSNEIEETIKNLPKNKSQEPDGFYQTFEEELIPRLLKLLHEIERKEYFQTYSMKLHSFQNRTRTEQKKRITGQSL